MEAEKILEKYFPLVIIDKDEWAMHVVKAMHEFSKQENKELIEEKESRIKELKNGSILRIIVSDVNKENKVLYSIIDALDGELIQMDIDKVEVFISRVRSYLNILKTNRNESNNINK